MNEIAVYTQTQMNDVAGKRDQAISQLHSAYRLFVDALRFSVANNEITLDQMKSILEAAHVNPDYYEHLFRVTVSVEVRASATVELVTTVDVEVPTDYTDDDLLEAVNDSIGYSPSEIIGDRIWEADWQDDDLEVISSEEI